MSNLVRALIGLFIVAHGLVHPILALVPQAESDPPVVGGFWTKSWLLGEGPGVKTAIYALAGLSALLLVMAGMSFMGFILPQEWFRVLALAGAGISLLLLVAFWHNWFVIGVIIDLALLVIILWTDWLSV